MSYNSKYTGAEVDAALGLAKTALQEHQDISGKQDKLVSGTNIKTINGTSLLGSGNIVISGGGGSGSSSDSDRKEVIYWEFADGPIEDMRPNVIYWYEALTEVIINSFEAPPEEVDSYDEFTLVVEFGGGGIGGIGGASNSLTLPSNVKWANGNIPDVTTANQWELSISRISDGYGFDKYFAVLTPFKSVE